MHLMKAIIEELSDEEKAMYQGLDPKIKVP